MRAERGADSKNFGSLVHFFCEKQSLKGREKGVPRRGYPRKASARKKIWRGKLLYRKSLFGEVSSCTRNHSFDKQVYAEQVSQRNQNYTKTNMRAPSRTDVLHIDVVRKVICIAYPKRP